MHPALAMTVLTRIWERRLADLHEAVKRQGAARATASAKAYALLGDETDELTTECDALAHALDVVRESCRDIPDEDVRRLVDVAGLGGCCDV